MSHSAIGRQPQLSCRHQSARQDENIDRLVERHDPTKIFSNPGQKATEHDTSARLG